MQNALFLAQQSSSNGGFFAALFGFVFFLFYLALIVVIFAGLWKVFVKAGFAGWWCLVPIANIWHLAKIGGLPGWVGLLIFVPFLGIIPAVYITYKVAQSFGFGIPMTLGLAFLPFVFYPYIGFGPVEYQGPAPSRFFGG